MQSIRAESITHTHTQWQRWIHAHVPRAGAQVLPFQNANQMPWIQFQKDFSSNSRRQHTNQGISGKGNELLLLAVTFCRLQKAAESETQTETQTETGPYPKTYNGARWVSNESFEMFQMLFAKCAKKKREKLEEGGFFSLFLPLSLLCPSHVFNKYHNEEVKSQQQQQRQQLKHLALSWCHLPPALLL